MLKKERIQILMKEKMKKIKNERKQKEEVGWKEKVEQKQEEINK